MAVARNGELVAFCRLARGTRRFDMTAGTWGDGGTATAAIRRIAARLLRSVIDGRGGRGTCACSSRRDGTGTSRFF